MPGIDHEVHEKTKRGAGHLAHCNGNPRPLAENEGGGYYAPDREYFPDGSFVSGLRFIPFRMSTECRYDQKIAPEHCVGCPHLGTGKAYAEMIERVGT